MPGNMGMNGVARKIKLSLLLSSLPPLPPSLQTDDRSKLLPLFSLHPSWLNHSPLPHVFIQQIYVFVDVSLHLAPSSPFPTPPPPFQFTLFPHFKLTCFTPLPPFVLCLRAKCHPHVSPLEVMDSLLCFLFPFPLSSSLFPQVSSTLYNQSVAPSYLAPSIPKPLSPLCSPQVSSSPLPPSLPRIFSSPNP